MQYTFWSNWNILYKMFINHLSSSRNHYWHLPQILRSSRKTKIINYKCNNILPTNPFGNMHNSHTITLRILWQPRWCSSSDTIMFPVTKFDAFALLRCYAAYLGRLFPTIRDGLSVLSSKDRAVLALPLKMWPTDCPWTLYGYVGMLERTNVTRHVTAESNVIVCAVVCAVFLVVVGEVERGSSLLVCFIFKVVVACCSVCLAECNISHILGLKLCCRKRKRNYTAQKWECNVDEVYLRDTVSVHYRCWLKVS